MKYACGPIDDKFILDEMFIHDLTLVSKFQLNLNIKLHCNGCTNKARLIPLITPLNNLELVIFAASASFRLKNGLITGFFKLCVTPLL